MKTIWSLPTENWMFLEQSSLNLLELSLVQIDHTWHFMNLTSPFNRIYVVFEGEARVSSLDQTIILKPGSVCLIPCGNSYSYECDGQAKKFFAHFTFKFANMDLFYQQPASVRRGTTHELNFFEQFQSNQPLDFQQTFTLKAKLLNLFAGFCPPDPAVLHLKTHSPKIFPVLDYIEKNIRADLSINELAEQFGRKNAAFSRWFSRIMHCSPQEYLHQKLSEASVQALLVTGNSIKDIAHELGFSDEFYFSRFFKKRNSYSPLIFRQLYRIRH